MMETIAIDSVRLRTDVQYANGDAPWIVFSNSLVTDLGIWEAQAAVLGKRFNLLRYDQRGHGGSDPGEEPAGFDGFGGDLLRLMDHYDIAEATAVGLSMGVPTVLSAYDIAPERFTALVLVDGQAASPPNAAETWNARIKAARESGMEEYARITAARWLTPDSYAALVQPLAAMMAKTRFEGFAAAAGALRSYDFRHVLPRITVPVLGLAGDADGTMPQTVRSLCETVADGRFLVIPKAGHVPCFEQPEAVTKAIEEFLDTLSGRVI